LMLSVRRLKSLSLILTSPLRDCSGSSPDQMSDRFACSFCRP
jgi:hypothetical protein